jgi:hypothetical protein
MVRVNYSRTQNIGIINYLTCFSNLVKGLETKKIYAAFCLSSVDLDKMLAFLYL